MDVDVKELSLLLSAGKCAYLKVAEDAAAALKTVLRPRTLLRIFPLENGRLGGSDVTLKGEDIARHMAGCHSAALLAATVGREADELTERLKSKDLALSHAVDTGAAWAVERVCDRAESSLRQLIAGRGQWLTPRFSCGYGDFPIEQQPQLLGLLDAFKTVGITVGSGFAMHPSKSVTALMGISPAPLKEENLHPFDCKSCRFGEVCGHKLCQRKVR